MPVFTGVAEQAADGCLVKPILHQFFQDESIEFSFSLHLERSGWRAPDGWFHASTHPLASARELYQYIAHPERIKPEPADYANKMACLFGTVAHSVEEEALGRMGVAVPLPDGDCPACGRPYLPKGRRQGAKYCLEHGAAHPETRSRCHMDKVLTFGPQGIFGHDFKTIRPYGLKGVRDMDTEQFREKWPKYYAQMQECMRLSGLRRYIVLFLGWGAPWEMREFHIDFDPAFAARTEAKYRTVLDHAARGVPILL